MEAHSCNNIAIKLYVLKESGNTIRGCNYLEMFRPPGANVSILELLPGVQVLTVYKKILPNNTEVAYIVSPAEIVQKPPHYLNNVTLAQT